ncbi:PDZ domain-containing protein [Virgibacillus ainsalahensis]
MTQVWGVEILQGIGKVFLNPLLYWILLLVILTGYKRIKKERKHFGIKVFDLFSEWKNTWVPSIVTGIIVSVAALGIGMVFTYETVLLLSIVIIILSLTLKFTLLSASYTIGITYVLLLFLLAFMENQSYINTDLFSQINFTGLVILLGVFLLVESILLKRVKRNETFPELTAGSRGGWAGQHHIRKMSIIPFFTLVPAGMITPFVPFWPYFSLGGESYGILLVPFLIGFDYKVMGSMPQQAARKLGRSTLYLAVTVLLLAIGSVYVSWLSLSAVLVAIIGREYINYRQRLKDRLEQPYFHQIQNRLKVLGVIPGTPAHRLDILVGETISKVNGKRVSNKYEFYHALQESGAYFKLELLDDSGEMRFVQGAFYEDNHHELGLIFTTAPHRSEKQ